MRFVDGVVALLVLVALAIGAGALRHGSEIARGGFRVVDGDTLAGEGRRLRLAGMDAPELTQTCHRRDGTPYRCGEVARDALRSLANRGEIVCRVSGQDRYGRDLARCQAGETDLGREMVRLGLAVSFGAYEPEQARAREEGIGLWEGSFEPPAEWRRAHAPPSSGHGRAGRQAATVTDGSETSPTDRGSATARGRLAQERP